MQNNQQALENYSYLQYLYENQKKAQSSSLSNNDSIIDPSALHLAHIPFILNTKLQEKDILIFYHNYLYGESQSQILLNMVKQKSSEPSTVELISLSVQQPTQKILQLIRILNGELQFNGTIIFDCYCQLPLKVYPFLQALAQLKKSLKTKFIIYLHPTQSTLINTLIQPSGLNFQIIENNFDTAFEISCGALLPQLTSFLNENMGVPDDQCQDIVIFHENPNQLTKRISHILRINNWHNRCELILTDTPSPLKTSKKCNIILAVNTSKLFRMISESGISLRNVFLVLDYGTDRKLYYDYGEDCFVEERGQASNEERMRRVCLIQGKVGQYIYDETIDITQETQISQREYYKEFDLGNYFVIMQMLKIKDQIYANAENRILKNLQRYHEYHQYKIQTVLSEQNHLPVSYLMSKLSDQRNQYSQQMVQMIIMSLSIIISPTLNAMDDMDIKSSYLESRKKPASIWQTSGYLFSALDLVSKLVHVNQNSDYGTLSKQLQFENESFKIILNKYRQLTLLYGFTTISDPYQLKYQQISHTEFEPVLQYLISSMKNSVRSYSGSRRLGYSSYINGSNQFMLMNRLSLTHRLNQLPTHLLITRISSVNDVKTILQSNSISQEVLLTCYGSLSGYSKQSFGESQIQFFDISSSVLNYLTADMQVVLENFEKQHQCSIQVDQTMFMIVLQCSKDREQYLKQTFSKLIDDVKETFKNQSQYHNYTENVRGVLGIGAQLQDLIIKNRNEKFHKSNVGKLISISKQAQLNDLKDLFNQFVQIKHIQLLQEQITNSAIIQFYSNNDFYKFNTYFNGCQYLGSKMYLQTYNPPIHYVKKQVYAMFEWNVWQSIGEGYIELFDELSAKQAEQSLRNWIEGSKTQIHRNTNKIYFSGLNKDIDEKDLTEWLKNHNKIKEILIKRSRFSLLRENDSQLNHIINKAYPIQSISQKTYPKSAPEPQHRIHSIQKDKNGQRVAKVSFKNKNKLFYIFGKLSNQKNLIGYGRLHVTLVFTLPIKIPHRSNNLIPIYQSILQEISEEIGMHQMIQYEIETYFHESWLIIKCNQEQQLEIIQIMLNNALKGQALFIDDETINNLLFYEFVLNSFRSLEHEYLCKIEVNYQTKEIRIIGRQSSIKMMEQEITKALKGQFVYPLKLYARSFKYFKNNQQILSKCTSKLKKVEMDHIKRDLILVGKLEFIMECKDQIIKIIKELADQTINEDQENYCGLCAEPYSYPFKLQSCGHRFCYNCIQQAIEISSKDINTYPLKCPRCLDKLYIKDLQVLANSNSWNKIWQIALNHMVNVNPQKYSFCFTPGCQNVISIFGMPQFHCELCGKAYCLKCNSFVHPKMSCQEARFGSDRLFKEYMKTINGRICTNPSCKAPIDRYSGCYKVLCTRCKKSLCFKCPQQSMKYFDTADEAYRHLNKAHGGCF